MNKIDIEENILVIGDIHGRDVWKDIIKKEFDSVDKVVFMGDYFDTPVFSREKVIKNFQDILRFKRRFKDKVVLLIGNHDFHYHPASKMKCSGYDVFAETEISNEVLKAIESGDMQLAYSSGNCMFSHAGFSNSWLSLHNVEIWKDARNINEFFHWNKHPFEFWRFDTGGFGEHPCQSPLWIRPTALAGELPGVWIQIVGHTPVDKIESLEDEIILVDALPKEYLKIIDGELEICKVKDL